MKHALNYERNSGSVRVLRCGDLKCGCESLRGFEGSEVVNPNNVA